MIKEEKMIFVLDNVVDILKKQHESFKLELSSFVDLIYNCELENDFLKKFKLNINEIYLHSCKISIFLEESFREILKFNKNPLKKNNYQNLWQKTEKNKIGYCKRFEKKEVQNYECNSENLFNESGIKKKRNDNSEKDIKSVINCEFTEKTKNKNNNGNAFFFNYEENFAKKTEKTQKLQNEKNKNLSHINFFENEEEFLNYNNSENVKEKSELCFNSKQSFLDHSFFLTKKSLLNLEKKPIENKNKNTIFKRGHYNIVSKQIKKEAVRIAQMKSFKIASDLLKISEKNIKRWMNNGIERKKGAGRKTLDPEMEKKLLFWIKNFFLQFKFLPNFYDVKKQAIKLSRFNGFKASKGWYDKFYIRNKKILETL
jgi:hypothetical protein